MQWNNSFTWTTIEQLYHSNAWVGNVHACLYARYSTGISTAINDFMDVLPCQNKLTSQVGDFCSNKVFEFEFSFAAHVTQFKVRDEIAKSARWYKILYNIRIQMSAQTCWATDNIWRFPLTTPMAYNSPNKKGPITDGYLKYFRK